MTLELNIFHLRKKHVHIEEECPKKVCLIDTIVEEECGQQQLQEKLIEELAKLLENLNEASYLCASFCPWRKKKEILPFLLRKTVERKQRKSLKSLISNPSPHN